MPRPYPATPRVAHHPGAMPRPYPATPRVAHHPGACLARIRRRPASPTTPGHASPLSGDAPRRPPPRGMPRPYPATPRVAHHPGAMPRPRSFLATPPTHGTLPATLHLRA